MKKDFARTDRLNQEIQKEVSSLIQQELKDPRLGMVTITGVKITSDLAYAKIYFSVLGDLPEIDKNTKLLNQASGFIRTQLAKKLKIRKIPEITFIFDKSLQYAINLKKLINQAIADDKKDDESSQ